jgi:hypothetical protein
MPLTALVELVAGVPVQVELSGPNRSKVIVPVGENPPERLAVSPIVAPTVTGPDACVAIVVLALVTVTLSLAAPHPLDTGLLPASPL